MYKPKRAKATNPKWKLVRKTMAVVLAAVSTITLMTVLFYLVFVTNVYTPYISNKAIVDNIVTKETHKVEEAQDTKTIANFYNGYETIHLGVQKSSVETILGVEGKNYGEEKTTEGTKLKYRYILKRNGTTATIEIEYLNGSVVGKSRD